MRKLNLEGRIKGAMVSEKTDKYVYKFKEAMTEKIKMLSNT